MANRGSGGRLGDGDGGEELAKLLKRMTSASLPDQGSKPPKVDEFEAKMRERKVRLAPTVQGRKAVAKQKAKSKKQFIKVPRHLAEEALRKADAELLDVTMQPAVRASSSDFGAAAYERIAKLRPALEDFIANEGAPREVDDATEQAIKERIALGAEAYAGIVDAEADGYVGCDFGTSTTKAVVRWPYDRLLGAIAVPIPLGWCSSGIPHLWPTILYFDAQSRQFSALPGADLVPLTGFKSALIEGRGHRMCCRTNVTMAEAATAFLAMHLAYVLGYITQIRPEARISSVNFGVPVAALADKDICRSFAETSRAALRLLNSAHTLTLDMVRASRASAEDGSLPYELHPELSGAIAGYCGSPRPYRGAHMIIDCGSATLDIASFNLGDGRWPVGIHAAGVDPLGADACGTYERGGATVEECRGASRFHEHRIFAETLKVSRSSYARDDDGRYPYQVILIGGGIDSETHGPFFKKMEQAFQRTFYRPELDPTLVRDDGTHAGRLILADGLANAPVDLREVTMPRDRPPSPKPPEPEMISKDQV